MWPAVAAYFAAKSPTKEDLKRVEDHLAEVDGHLSEQNKREALTKLAQRVSISVTGEERASEPLTLFLKTKDPNVTLIRVELINDVDMLSGEANCSRLDPLTFTATVPPQIAQRWFGSCPVYQSVNRKMAYIRAIMKIEGREGHKTLRIPMSELEKKFPNTPYSEKVFSITGEC